MSADAELAAFRAEVEARFPNVTDRGVTFRSSGRLIAVPTLGEGHIVKLEKWPNAKPDLRYLAGDARGATLDEAVEKLLQKHLRTAEREAARAARLVRR